MKDGVMVKGFFGWNYDLRFVKLSYFQIVAFFVLFAHCFFPKILVSRTKNEQ